MKMNTLAALGLIASVAPTSLAAAQGYGYGDGEHESPSSGYEEPAPEPVTEIWFDMERPQIIKDAGCAPYATAKVHVKSEGPVEVMEVSLSNLPPNTEFDFFVTQVPNFPFGLSWYQGDIETDEYGEAEAKFIGRFNAETFFVAVGSAPAPQIHETDAAENPTTAPVHTLHLGLWFESPEDAAAAGCPDITTPFNGEHNAGVQVLNTGSFPDEAGPLGQLK